MEDITSEVVDELTASCSDCEITSGIIDRQSFSCNPESPTYVTYRARLEGTSETDSGSLIILIEDWVRGGASIIVKGVRMTVDSECSVAISSLNEGECLEIPPTPDPTPDHKPTTDTSSMSTTSSTNANGSSNTAIIIGVTLTAVIVLSIVIAVTVVIIVALRLVVKTRRGDLSIKKAE